jgi:hypothetical protein
MLTINTPLLAALILPELCIKKLHSGVRQFEFTDRGSILVSLYDRKYHDLTFQGISHSCLTAVS